MTLSTLLITYLLGGLTFIPLLLAAVFVPAWLALPKVERGSDSNETIKKEGDAHESNDDLSKDVTTDEKEDRGASGTFAVLRRYDLPAANAALRAENNGATGSGSGTAGPDGKTGDATSSGSESVYQSMYRSVFDRNKNTTSTTSVLENEDGSLDGANGKVKKRVTPANVFYIVMRHGHLMLYDSAAGIEVRHVISLAHHSISLSAGPDNPDEQELKDSDLFIKRTAIVVTPIADLPNGELNHLTRPPKRPFYLFSATCIEKEDFYHALLTSYPVPPIPDHLRTDDIIKLQSILHSTLSLTPETKAFNALVSRLFLSLYRTDRLKTLVQSKIEKKISRVQKPAFIASLAVQSISLGDSFPVLSNPRLKDLNISGDTTIAFDLRYAGGLNVTVSALAKLDLGPRFKTRTADLLLSTSLQRLHGHMLVRVKPPPSNRIWFCFEMIPEMDIKVEPVVQSRQITYTFILKAIEDRIRSVVAETLVKPNWDDVAFFDTRGQDVRGGIWREGPSLQDEIVEEARIGEGAEALREKNKKTMSMPALVDAADSSATSSGSEKTTTKATGYAATDEANELKRRSVASLPPERELQTPPSLRPKPLGSPSFASPSASAASVQLDESPANIEPYKRVATAPQPQQKKWRLRPAPANQTPSMRKDAAETMREMRDRGLVDREGENGDEGTVTAEPTDIDNEGRRSSEALPEPENQRRPKRVNTNASTASASTARSQRQQEAVQRGKDLLAATAAATTAARNWSWNALANQRAKAAARGERGAASQGQQQGPQEPLGRGQPLPPPGVPLPGPQRGWLPTGVGSVKRKPLLPPRRPTIDQQSESKEINGSQVSVGAVNGDGGEVEDQKMGQAGEDAPVASPADEFGPWTENSGTVNEVLKENEMDEPDPHTAGEDEAGEDEDDLIEHTEPATSETATVDRAEITELKRKPPPPLPARRRPISEETDASADDGQSLDDPEQSERLPPSIDDDIEALHAQKDTSHDYEMENGTEDTEELVAIPAPVDEDADERQLEAEGVESPHGGDTEEDNGLVGEGRDVHVMDGSEEEGGLEDVGDGGGKALAPS